MKYLLDTNICIYVIRQKPAEVLARFRSFQAADLGVSAVTVSELYYGISKSTRPERNRESLTKFLFPLGVVDYGEEAAYFYGQIRRELELKGRIIGPMDLMIAAHALSLGLPVVTNNTREFTRVPGLAVENWV